MVLVKFDLGGRVEGSDNVSGSDKIVSDEMSIGSFVKFASP